MVDTVMNTYARLPVTFEKGDGAWLWDAQGNRYLDALSGIAVCGLGHAHPAVASAIADQAQKLIHTSNIYGVALQNQLADQLIQITQMDKVFFCNSGAEANEAAIKIARRYGHEKNIEIPHIVVLENSFHGRTLATLTATGNRKVQAGFEPLVQGFIRAPYNDLDALRNIAHNRKDVVAILLEPVLGEGGIRIPDTDYLQQIRALCDEHEWLMMLDEIQTGMCRTGKWFAYQHANISPDVITVAKGLGNGVPIGACIAGTHASSVLGPGNHGSTFGGNPLACRAALAVIDTLEQHNLAARATVLGKTIVQRLQTRIGNTPGVADIRGLGLMIGVELEVPCTSLMKQALTHGILINVTAQKVIRILPPLVLSDDQALQIADKISDLVEEFLSSRS